MIGTMLLILHEWIPHLILNDSPDHSHHGYVDAHHGYVDAHSSHLSVFFSESVKIGQRSAQAGIGSKVKG